MGGISSVEDCPKGFKCPGKGVIVTCNTNSQYQDQPGQTECKTISNGYCKVDDMSPQIPISSVPSGKYCLTDGRTFGVMRNCPVGSYQPNTGQTSCIPASPGYQVDTTGSTTQKRCPVNTGSPGGLENCLACSEGNNEPYGCSSSIICSKSDICSTKCCTSDLLLTGFAKTVLLGLASIEKGVCRNKEDAEWWYLNSECMNP